MLFLLSISLIILFDACNAFIVSQTSIRSNMHLKNGEFEFGECSKVEVCTIEKYCKRRKSAAIWKLFQELAPQAGIEIEESECFFECQTGPNIRLDNDDKRIIGGIKNEEMVRKVLGLPPAPPEEGVAE